MVSTQLRTCLLQVCTYLGSANQIFKSQEFSPTISYSSYVGCAEVRISKATVKSNLLLPSFFPDKRNCVVRVFELYFDKSVRFRNNSESRHRIKVRVKCDDCTKLISWMCSKIFEIFRFDATYKSAKRKLVNLNYIAV